MSDESVAPRPGPLSPEDVRELTTQPLVARFAVLDEDGYPYIVPVWFEYDGEHYWIVAREHVAYVPLVQRDSRVALSIAEDVPPQRRMLVRGRVEVVEGPALEGKWREVLTRIARRYIGPNGDEYLERSREIKRFLLRLTPERVQGFRGFR